MVHRYHMRGTVGLILLLLLFGSVAGQDACRIDRTGQQSAQVQQPALESGDKDTYTGTIRVYVTQTAGRWADSDGNWFHNPFLAFALQESISLGEADTLNWDMTWNGHNYYDVAGDPFSDIPEDSVKVIAAVFNSAGYTGYSDPPSSGQFTVHEVDACAAATVGTTGYNISNTDFTHTVLVEDGATTW